MDDKIRLEVYLDGRELSNLTAATVRRRRARAVPEPREAFVARLLRACKTKTVSVFSPTKEP